MADDMATFAGLEPELLEARRNRDTVAEALQRHMREHGC